MPARAPNVERPSEPSTALLRATQTLFALGALAAVVTFGGAVRDGETRRAPESLLRNLAPEYQGNNRIAPDFTLRDREGHAHKLSDYRGKVVVLHFWSRTCAPCIDELQREIPTFDEIVKGRNDVALLLVTTDPDWNSVSALVPEGLSAPILFDGQSSVVGAKYGTRLFPETWIIDRNGVIRARFDRTLEWGSAVLLDYLLSLR